MFCEVQPLGQVQTVFVSLFRDINNMKLPVRLRIHREYEKMQYTKNSYST